MDVDDVEPVDEPAVATNGISNSVGIPEYEPVVVPPAPDAVMSFDGTGPRLMITHIVNENFKSYAGTQTLGPFHKSFSSIVGPNGSGKSNVIDSMLFVFGYRATKIRSKKISVLIHSSEDHRSVDSCTVSVHFQKIIDRGSGEDEYDIVAASQFVVSRTAFRDNSSFYKVDDRRVTYKEVASLLRSCGIDLDHNRFLILQGEVEQIAMMKAKAPNEHEDGMLEFLEDIVGSSRYKEPICVLSKRVDELNELRSEKLNRVKCVEKEKDDLECVKNEALEYLRLENKIVEKKNFAFQNYIQECTALEKKAVEKRDVVKARVEEINAGIAKITDGKRERVKEAKKCSKKLEELEKKCEEKNEEFHQMEQQDSRIREDQTHAHSQAKKLEKALAQEQKKLSELKLIPEKNEKELGELSKRLDTLQEDKQKGDKQLKEVMESFKTETKDLQIEKEVKEKELLELQKVVNETKSKYSVAQSELDLCRSDQASEANKLAETRKNLENITATVKERKSAVEKLNKEIPNIEKELQKAQDDLKVVTTSENKIADEVRQMRVRVEEARSSMQASRSQGKVLESLMQLKRTGHLPGIHGRLGDLGAIDEKYDVAISTACAALDHIVVDTINTGQKCVEHLKQNGVGIATFIGLDKMERWKSHSERTLTTPENVPRLFDLVKVKDASFLPVFYFALRDTLVVKDLDQATRIAYGKTRYRVVTLAGQLIETSGTMSGGGSRVCKGKMGSSLVVDMDPKTMQDLEKQLEKGSQQVVQCREKRSKLEEATDRLQKALREAEHSREKYTLEIKSLVDQEASLIQQEKEQQVKVNSVVTDEKKLKELERKVTDFKKGYDDARQAAEKVDNLVQSLHKQIMDIGGNKMKAVQSKLDVIIAQIDQTNGLINKANVAIRTAKRNTDKSVQKIDDIQTDIKKNQEKLEKLDGELKQIEVDARKVLDEHNKAKEAKKEAQGTLSEMTAALDKEDAEETELKKKLIEEKHELDTLENSVKENQTQMKHWKKQLDKLGLHQIEPDKSEETLPTLTAEQIAAEVTDKEEYNLQITKLEEELASMKPNLASIAEYRKKEEIYLKRVSELDQITDMRNAQRRQHDDLRKRRLDEFMAGFTVITTRLKEMYQMITLGGDAELELVDSLDPFSEGIVFSVRPPKKSWKNISNLSGGEKTLSSLALVFALHHYKPTPLYVMDEIDAALDFKNVSIVANYIKERTKNAQFIIISLRNNMFELADRLVGIYKTHNCTKSVTVNPNKVNLPRDDNVALVCN